MVAHTQKSYVSLRGRPPFLLHVSLKHEQIVDASAYPFVVPAVRALDALPLASVTYFVGENGSESRRSSKRLPSLRASMPKGDRPTSPSAPVPPNLRCIGASALHAAREAQDGLLPRGESFYNVASEIDRLDVGDS